MQNKYIKAINSGLISNNKKATNLIQLNEFYKYKNILIKQWILKSNFYGINLFHD
jgi:hypothetical protein